MNSNLHQKSASGSISSHLTSEIEKKPENPSSTMKPSVNLKQSLHSRSSSLIENPNFGRDLGSLHDHKRHKPLARQRRCSQSLSTLKTINQRNSTTTTITDQNNDDKNLNSEKRNESLNNNDNTYRQHALNNYNYIMNYHYDDIRLRLNSSGYDEEVSDEEFAVTENWASSQASGQPRMSPVADDDEESSAFDDENNDSCSMNELPVQGQSLDSEGPDLRDVKSIINDPDEQRLAFELSEAGLFELPPGYPTVSLSRQNLLQFRITGVYLRKISQDFIK